MSYFWIKLNHTWLTSEIEKLPVAVSDTVVFLFHCRYPLQAAQWLCYTTPCNATLHSLRNRRTRGFLQVPGSSVCALLVEVTQRARSFRTKVTSILGSPINSLRTLKTVRWIWVNREWNLQLIVPADVHGFRIIIPCSNENKRCMDS